MRAVNLIPADRRGSRRSSSRFELPRSPLLILAIVAALAVFLGVVIEVRSATSTVSSRQRTLRDLDAQVAKLPPPKPAGTTALSRVGIAETVASQRTSWDGFMTAVSRVIPEDVWLLNMTAQATGGTTAAAPVPSSSPTAFVVTGYTYSQPAVARLMRRLRLVPWLNGVSLTTSSKAVLDNHLVYQFTLGANVISLPEVGS